MTLRREPTTRAALAFAVVATLLASGCTPPIRARHVDAHRVHRHLISNVLSTGELSSWTANVLYNRDLVTRYQDDPAGALAELHAALVAGMLQPDETAALAELAFHHAEDGGGRPYYLASALYAWSYIFPGGRPLPDRGDPRVRLGYDLYNRGVTSGFAGPDGKTIDLRAGSYALPFGRLEVAMDPDALQWGHYLLHDFVPVAELEVKGFPTYYRRPGIGAPLAAAVTPVGPEAEADLLAPRARVPVTAVLELVPGVAAHSIIAVKDDTPLDRADDGVVKYESAHIDGVESEVIVRSPHSCQQNPHTIAEVRRILLLHLETEAPPVAARGPTAAEEEKQ